MEVVKQYVVCAANRNELTGLTICGARHWDTVMCSVADALGYDARTDTDIWDEGFIDQFGNYLSREEAAALVKVNGQQLHGDLKTIEYNCLFSENLY